MDELCRLCLNVGNEMSSKLRDGTKIWLKLYNLNIQLHTNELLPNQVCLTCFNKLEDFENFRENVIQNEYKLIQFIENGKDLRDFLHIIKTEVTKDDMKVESQNDSSHEELIYYEPIDKDNKRNAKRKTKRSIKRKWNGENHAKKSQEVMNQIELKKENDTDNSNTQKIINEAKNFESNKANNSIQTELNINPKKNTVNYYLDTNTARQKTDTEKELSKNVDGENFNDTKDQIEVETNDENIDMSHTNTSKLRSNSTEQTPIDNSKEKTNDAQSTLHKCLTCLQNLDSHVELINHYKSLHNITKDTLESTESDFSLHTSEDNNIHYKCNYCNELFETKDDVLKHMFAHNTERPYLCKICGRTFKCVYEIIRHARAHSDITLYCSHGCGYHTVYKGALKDHEKRHEKDFKYKCATCGAGFHVKTWHDQHQNIHNNVKPFVCDVCGMAFHMHRYLTSHRTTVHPDSVKDVKRYICTHCYLPCYSKHSFKIHLEEHEIKTSFLCDVCGKVCSTSEQLKYHKNSHLGLKPYSCGICNKKFAKKFNLSIHEKAHSGEKHLCQSCGKYFAQRSTLLRHCRKRHPDGAEQSNGTEQRELSFSNY